MFRIHVSNKDKEEAKMKKYIGILLASVCIFGLLSGCEVDSNSTDSSSTTSSAKDSSSQSTSFSEMTDTEVLFIESEIELLEENVEHFQKTGEVKDAEVVYAILQEICEYNLTQEQEKQIAEVVSHLPEEFIDYQKGLLLSTNGEGNQNQ